MKAKLRRNARGELEIERFSPFRRLEHWVAAFCFIALIVTGFPQKLDDWTIGHWLVSAMGGLDNTRWIHRVIGLVFCGQAAVHVAGFAWGAFTGKLRMALVPTLQDARDAKGMLDYYLGRRKTAPPMPKFDYRQKFEYMGMILGGVVMIVSGLALMYPVLVAAWVPGFLLPVARVLHSSEAVLALSVLVVWHVYGASLSPDIFPFDKSMLTGYQAVSDLKHHHRREYDAVFGADGEPEAEEPSRGSHAAHR